MEALIADFETYNRSKNLTENTICWYSRKLRDFCRWLDGAPLPPSPRTVREYISQKLSKGLKASTVRSYFAALSAFYSFLVADGLLDETANPMRSASAPRVPQVPIKALEETEIACLLACFHVAQPAGYRNYTICLLLLDTGLRACEVAGLTIEDIDWANQRLSVLGKGRKHRYVYFGKRTGDTLRQYLNRCRPNFNHITDALFPSLTGLALRPDEISKMVTRHLDRAGIPRAGLSAHRLRHTFAIKFLRQGGGVFHLQQLLGHSTLAMTRRYVMLTEDDLAAAHKRASPVDSLNQMRLF